MNSSTLWSGTECAVRCRTLMSIIGSSVAALSVLSSCASVDRSEADSAASASAQAEAPEHQDPCINWSRAYFTVPLSEKAASPVDAVRKTAGASVAIVRREQKAENVVVISVAHGDEEGEYETQRTNGRWVVIGGQGCGAQAGRPRMPTDGLTDCATATLSPGGNVVREACRR